MPGNPWSKLGQPTQEEDPYSMKGSTKAFMGPPAPTEEEKRKAEWAKKVYMQWLFGDTINPQNVSINGG